MNFSQNYQISSQLHSHSSAALIPFSNRFENALKEPIAIRCHSLSLLIHESISTNIKEMQSNYQTLVENIFSFGSESHAEWGLKLISRGFNARDFDTVFGFLGFNGSLFQLIRHLMNDPINRYEFPKSCLPMPTKLSLEEGVIPSLFVNKISHGFANTISLNALEFYLFHFSYFMVNATPNMYYQQNPYYSEQINNANSTLDVLYYALLESYLNYFMPQSNANINANQQQSSHHSSIWQSLSSTTSSLLHLGSGSQSYNSKQQTSPQNSTLFKSSLLNLKPLLSSSTYANESSEKTVDRMQFDPLGTQIYKCETVLLIFTEIWLNHAIPHSLNKKQLSPSHQPLFTPTSDHMKAVRIFIKHIHYFANSYNKKLSETLRVLNSSLLDDVKSCIWSSKYPVQKKLYSFLRLSFERWPNDSSFRIPLETWLSYIQPWRYILYTYKESELIFESDKETDDHISILDYQWKQFISDNLLFYTVIFRQLISRFSKLLEFSSFKNAYMLFRLTKVFSQNNLWRWIKEAEESLLMNDASLLSSYSWNTLSTSRTNLLSPSIRQPNVASISGNFKHPLMELELNTFEYIPLFSPSIKSIVMHLLTEIYKSTKIVDEMITISTACESNSNSSSSFNIFGFITSLFAANDDISNADENKKDLIEKKKTKNYLQMCSNHLSRLFEIPEPHTICDDQFESQSAINDTSTPFLTHRTKDNARNEIYDELNGTPKLTPLGRYQVLNRLRKPELNILEGNPDEQPVRTFEFSYLVRLVIFISHWINNNYGQHIIRAYNKQSFLGIFFRQFISPPVSYVQIVRNNTNRPPDRKKQELPPRINLRFVANKFYLCYAFIIITVVYILNYSLISFLFVSLLIVLAYFLTKSVIISLTNNLTH